MNPASARPHRFVLPAWVDPGAAVLGLQMAVAGTAAFYGSLLLRLEYPSWSVFTVIMLLSAQYVGAIQEKAVFRMVGTVLGGLLGYLATGAWQQTPVLYLGLTFAVTAFSVAMFSQSRAPYAFFLTGLTFIIIAINGQSDPQMAWQYSLARVEEVLVGVTASLVAQSTLWPRYANEEFRRQLRATLEELAESTPRGTGMFHRTDEGLDCSLRDFPRRATALRQLLYFGSRESRTFRRNLAMHGSAVAVIARAANLLRSLDLVEPAPEPYLSALSADFDQAGRLLRDGWLQLRDHGRLEADWTAAADHLLNRIDDKLLALRTNPDSLRLGSEKVGPVSAHILTLLDLHACIVELDGLWRNPPLLDRADSLALAPEWPDRAAIKRGIRAGLATTMALIIANWLSPPGQSLMMLCVFNFTALNYAGPNGIGDHRAFLFVLRSALIGAGTFLGLLVFAPMMASYAVVNILLAAWLFVQGYHTFTRGGMTRWMMFSGLLLVSILSLNAQEPVSFEKIAAVFFGLVNGAVLAALWQRLLWPVLPQTRLRHGLTSYLRTIAGGIDAGIQRLPLWQRTRVALFPSEARQLVGEMSGPSLPDGEAQRLQDYVSTLQKLAGGIILCSGRLAPSLPPNAPPDILPTLQDVKTTLTKGLDELAAAFDTSASPRNEGDMAPLMARWDDCMVRLRQTFYAEKVAPRAAVVPMGLAYRYRLCLRLLEQAFDEARGLRTADYLGDVTL
jgi:uncharacterized membrane protein YccC